MTFLRKLGLTTLSLLSSGLTFAAYIPPEKALQSALTYKSHLINTRGYSDVNTAAMQPVLAYEGYDKLKSTLPAYYVFNYPAGSGFIILSADDSVAPVLGFSDAGSFDPESLPTNLKSWLDSYADQISRFTSSSHSINSDLNRNNSGDNYFTPTRADLDAIEPLISTKWNQLAPFNDQCPVINNRKAPTGCTATALAQIMNYHKWPQDFGNDSWSYSRDGYSVSFNFGATKFDWDNMTNTYDNNSTVKQKEAVATLMYACGVVTDMFYNLDGSGAYMFYIPENLAHYLGYAEGARYILRSHYSYSDWEEIIYNELAESRPVQYEGYSTEGGHSFVVDGYLGNHFFHINWGWGGSSDGYYLLSALNPGEQGIGSFEGGYNSEQGAVIGLRPDDGTPRDTYVSVYSDGPLSLRKNTLRLRNYTIYSGVNPRDVAFSTMFESVDGNKQPVILPSTLSITMNGYVRGEEDIYYGENQVFEDLVIPFDEDALASLATGKYRVYPIYKSENMDWTPLPISEGLPYLTVNIGADGTLTALNDNESISELKVLGLSEKNIFKWSDGYNDPKFEIAVTNISAKDYSGPLNISIRSTEDNIDLTPHSIIANLPAHRTISFTYDGGLPSKSGEYLMKVEDEKGSVIGELTLSITSLDRGDLFVNFTELPAHIYEKMDFRRNKLAVTYYNAANEPKDMKPELRLLGNDLKEIIGITEGTKRTMKAGEERRLEYGAWNLGQNEDYVPAGDYYLQIINAIDGTQLSLPVPVRVWKEDDRGNGVFFGINSCGESYVAPSEGVNGYVGVLDIPEYALINGKEYPITSFSPDALTMAKIEGVVLRAHNMSMSQMSMALSKVARNESVLYLSPDIYYDMNNEALMYGLETYLLAGDYFFEVESGDLDAVTPDASVLGYINCELPTRVLLEWDRNMTLSTTSPDITVRFLESYLDGGGVPVEISVKDVSAKGNVIITPRQPYAKAIILAVNGGDDTAVDDMILPEFKVSAKGGVISVTGAKAGSEIAIVALDGTVFARGVTDGSGCCNLNVASKGIYIIQCGCKTMKVIM